MNRTAYRRLSPSDKTSASLPITSFCWLLSALLLAGCLQSSDRSDPSDDQPSGTSAAVKNTEPAEKPAATSDSAKVEKPADKADASVATPASDADEQLAMAEPRSGQAVREVAAPDATKSGVAAATADVPKEAADLYAKAVDAAKTARNKEAMDLFTDLVHRYPKFRAGRKDFSVYLLQRGALMQAADHLAETVRLFPEDGDARNDYGVALTRMDDVQQAIKEFRRAISLDPGHPDAQYNLGFALATTGEVDEAIAQFRKAIKLRPSYLDARFQLARAFLSQGKMDEAEVQLKEIINIRHEHAMAHATLGRIYVKQGKLTEARRQFNEALRVNPQDAEVRYELGMLLVEQGADEPAISQFKACLRQRPDHVRAHYQLAMLLASKPGEATAKEASRHNSQALEGWPDWPEVLNNQAWLLATNPAVRSPRQAVQMAEHAKELAEYKLPRVYDTLAAAYAAAGRFDDAQKAAVEGARLARSSGQDSLAEEIEARIERYKAGQTIDEPAATEETPEKKESSAATSE